MRQLSLILTACLLVALGCEKAGRYPPRPVVPADLSKLDGKEESPVLHDWAPPKPASELPPDIPIVFVAATLPDGKPNPEWASMPEKTFWQFVPGPVLVPNLLTWPNLGLAAALQQTSSVHLKIKVPLGLPDPTPLIPAANPPTYARWKLGQELFFEKSIPVEGEGTTYACASCHQPEQRFTDGRIRAERMTYNTPTLINAAYNRHQFWDGRVTALEEVVTRNLTKDEPKGEQFARHSFGGFTSALLESKYYRDRFHKVFGTNPTQDLVSKALATYMRTLLSGNSIFDRADKARGKDKELTAAHFKGVVTNDDVTAFGQKDTDALASQLDKGYQLFKGKASCAACHPVGGLFTDHDFHNIGVMADFDEKGRLAHVPVGLRVARWHGAYRTPSLRTASHTAPYMHFGTIGAGQPLLDAVKFYNGGIHKTPYLAAVLRDDAGNPRKLGLTEDEMKAVADFVRALDGDPVAAMVTQLPKKM